MPSLVVVVVGAAAVLIGSGGLASAQPQRAQDKAPFSPSHWWTADGNAQDAVGNDDGTALNGADYAPGLRGLAFHFNGEGAEYRFDEVGGNFDRRPFTLAFFIRTTSNAQQAIWEKRPVCDAASFWGFRMTGGGGVPAGETTPAGEMMSDATGADYTFGMLVSGRNVSDGDWHHVALVRTGTQAKIYVDGTPAATARTPHPVTLANAVPMRVGMSACTFIDGTVPLDGELDEIMIFDHALSRPNIQTLIGFLRSP
jgi:concanavalin A-like lectin/glucanase superfamily protein